VTSISSFSGALYVRAVDAKRHEIQLRTKPHGGRGGRGEVPRLRMPPSTQ